MLVAISWLTNKVVLGKIVYPRTMKTIYWADKVESFKIWVNSRAITPENSATKFDDDPLKNMFKLQSDTVYFGNFG